MDQMNKVRSIMLIWMLTTSISFGQINFEPSPEQMVKVDSIIGAMSIDEKIGQLFMIRAFSHNDQKNITLLKNQIKKYKPGGICFFQGSPRKQAQLTNEYQKLSNIPMLISIDGEWGLGMRFRKDAVSFPKQLTLGAVDDHNLIYDMGREIAYQMKRIGIHINFAPVVDINNNAANPVINIRSFGENKDNVASKSYAYMKGMQDGGLGTCIKHFPGHGDTDVDSHYDLPIIKHSRARLDSLELAPFRSLIKKGADGVMVAHLQVPIFDDRKNRPTSLSKYVIEDLLKEELGFKGMVYTDAMDMKGVTKHFKNGSADFEAFMAGADIILVTESIDKGFAFLKKKFEEGILTEDRINRSLKKILIEKARFNILNSFNPIELDDIHDDINNVRSQVIKYKIYERSLTLAANNGVLPIIGTREKTFASISLGRGKLTPFQKRIQSYVPSTQFNIPKSANSTVYKSVANKLNDKDYVIIGIHDMSRHSSKNFGITEEQLQFINNISSKSKVIISLFGSPYALKYFENQKCLLVAYEDDEIAQDIAAQGIFGALDIVGTLPVTASDKFRYKHGITLPGIKRLGYAIPERVELNSDTLNLIQDMMDKMIREKAAPGAQVLIAKDNKIVYNKGFGYYTYDNKKKVSPETIYDVASITKVLASTISAMHLHDNSTFEFEDTVADYFSEEDTTNKSGLVYMDMMSHVSGLIAWIPFFESTLTNNTKRPKPSDKYYRKIHNDTFSIEVNSDLYMREDYQDTIWRRVFSSRERNREYHSKNKYLYSDLAFYMLNWTIERKTTKQVDEYAKENFYNPLGLRHTTFNPLQHFSKRDIAPTERDNYFRMGVVQGHVHDMGAAMLGGVSGHAGLFSTASDVAVLMQMLLNRGYYGGKRYIDESTVDFCTKRHPESTRRGVGFDMKELDPSRIENMSQYASQEAFGHLGFTGCATFADPEHDLVYVLLSNRTYPSMKNNKFGKNNYRPKVQSIIYRSLIDQ